MTKFTITFNDGETHDIEATYIHPEFADAWWSYDPEGNEPYEYDEARPTIPLSDTMYFHVEIKKGVPVGAKIHLQLFDYDEALWLDIINPDDDEFPDEAVHKLAEVKKVGDRLIASVELKLEDHWAEVVESDIDNTIDLYWLAQFGGHKEYLPRTDKEYLQVGRNTQTLFVKPASDEYPFPEMMNLQGEPIIFTKPEYDEQVYGEDIDDTPSTGELAKKAAKGVNALDKAAQKANEMLPKGSPDHKIFKTSKTMAHSQTQKIALVKLERGQMVDNFGKVYDKPRNIYTNDVYTNESKLLKNVKQGKNFGYKHQGQPLKSTKYTSQFDYFAKNGTKVKLIGIAKHAGTFFDFANVLQFAAKDNETAQESAAPIPHILGVATAPIIEHAKTGWDEATDAAIQQDLEEKYKPRGLEGLQEFVRDFGEFQKYELESISPATADKMLKGEFKSIEELIKFDDSVNEINKNVHILHKQVPDQSRGLKTNVIETIIYDYD